MFGSYFNNETIRRANAVFGTLFNEIYVGRLDGNGNLTDQKRVPLSYAPRQKMLERIQERPDLVNDTKTAIKLPRMSFQDDAPVYDPERQQSALSYCVSSNTNLVWSPAAYRIPFELNFYVRNKNEADQILGQILPYFKPSLGLKMKPIAGNDDIVDDVNIILQSITKDDSFDGEFTTRRAQIYTLTFDFMLNFYGRVEDNQKTIKTAIIEFNDSDGNREQELKQAVNPSSAEKDGVYTIDLTILNELENT